MKDDTCKTCKWFKGDGTACVKSGGVLNYSGDSCGAYKFKRADFIIDRFFTERRVAMDQNIFKNYTRSEMV